MLELKRQQQREMHGDHPDARSKFFGMMPCAGGIDCKTAEIQNPNAINSPVRLVELILKRR